MQHYWQEEQPKQPPTVPKEIADLNFRVECRGGLPIDHAYALNHTLVTTLPWFADEPRAAMHTLYGAESGNGWMRPYQEGEYLYLSRRTRLRLRLPQSRFDDARVLEGQTLVVSGCHLKIGYSNVRLLSSEKTLYTRSLVSDCTDSEDAFLQQAADQLIAIGIHPKKMISGRIHPIKTPAETLLARSLMVINLEFDESIRLQQIGLGDKQKFGCGIFLAHKSTDAVYQP